MSNSNQYASVLRRFGAMIIDSVIICIPLYIVSGFMMKDSLSAMSDPTMTPQSMSDTGSSMLVVYLVFMILYLLYYAYFESSQSQATFGKRLLKMKVVGKDGERISFSKGLIRAVGRIVSSIILNIGYLMAFFSDAKQSLHDKMAGTYVVMTSQKADLNRNV